MINTNVLPYTLHTCMVIIKYVHPKKLHIHVDMIFIQMQIKTKRHLTFCSIFHVYFTWVGSQQIEYYQAISSATSSCSLNLLRQTCQAYFIENLITHLYLFLKPQNPYQLQVNTSPCHMIFLPWSKLVGKLSGQNSNTMHHLHLHYMPPYKLQATPHHVPSISNMMTQSLLKPQNLFSINNEPHSLFLTHIHSKTHHTITLSNTF